MPAQPAQPPVFLDAWPDIAPTHTIEFAESHQITGAAVAPDGSVVYAQIHIDAIDLWRVATRYWPELLGGLLALIALAVLITTIRIARRPRRKASPYCRRCNYDLSQHATRSQPAKGRPTWTTPSGARCPECGTMLRPRSIITGRRLIRRCAPAWTLLLILAAGYGAMFAAGIVRADTRLQWFRWPSTWAAAAARTRGIAWLIREIQPINRIAVVDVATGQRLPDLWQGGTASYMAPALSRDGEYLVVADGEDGVLAIDTSSGTVAGRVRAALEWRAYPSGLSAAQFPTDQPLAYLCTMDVAQGASHLLEWDVATGQTRIAAQTIAFRSADVPAGLPERHHWSARWFSVAHIDGRLHAVSAPSFEEWYDTRRGNRARLDPVIEWHDLSTGAREAVEHTQGDGTKPLLLSGRGAIVDLPAILTTQTWMRRSVQTNANRLDMRLQTAQDGGIDRTQRLVIFQSHRQINTLDLETMELLSNLTHPDEYIAPRIYASTCEHHIAAVAFRSANGPFIHALMLYDLAPLRAQLAREDALRAAQPPATPTTTPTP